MSILGAGLAPMGSSLGGFGSVGESVPIVNEQYKTANNLPGNARYINPQSRDYEMNDEGFWVGEDVAQQMVYLALLTVKGSSANTKLGQTFSNIPIIGSNFKKEITVKVADALNDLIINNVITLDGVEVIAPRQNQVSITVKYTAVQSNRSFTHQI